MNDVMLKEIYARVVDHPDFLGKGYLVHFFGNLKDDFSPEGNWQVGFYLPEEKVVQTYSYDAGNLSMEEGKPFQKVQKHVDELKLEEVHISFDEMKRKVNSFLKETYPGKFALKIILVVQVIEVPVWNLTLVTSDFNTLNVKVDAKTGDILDHQLSNLLQWNAS
jgi:uncharacterized membrane protein YkoI